MSKGPGSENYRLNNTKNEFYALSLLERNIGRKEHYNFSILTTRHRCTCGRHDECMAKENISHQGHLVSVRAFLKKICTKV
jgi:hypothetical protein